MRFTRPEIPGQNTLLSVVYVQRKPEVKMSDAEISQRITLVLLLYLLVSFMGNVLEKNREFLGYPSMLND